MDNLERVCTLLESLPAQMSFFLLKNCFAVPKYMYTLRTALTYLLPYTLAESNNILRQAIETIFDCQARRQGLESSTAFCQNWRFWYSNSIIHRATAVLTSSWASSYDLVIDILQNHAITPFLEHAIKQWKALSQVHDPPLSKHRQKDWMRPIYTRELNIIKSDLNEPVDIVRINGSSCSGSGDWINSLPSSSLGLTLSDDQYRVACALRLGAMISSQSSCVCGTVTYQKAHHALTCPTITSRFQRHSMCNVLINKAFHATGTQSTLEPIGLLRNDRLPWQKVLLLLTKLKSEREATTMTSQIIARLNLLQLKHWVE